MSKECATSLIGEWDGNETTSALSRFRHSPLFCHDRVDDRFLHPDGCSGASTREKRGSAVGFSGLTEPQSLCCIIRAGSRWSMRKKPLHILTDLMMPTESTWHNTLFRFLKEKHTCSRIIWPSIIRFLLAFKLSRRGKISIHQHGTFSFWLE